MYQNAKTRVFGLYVSVWQDQDVQRAGRAQPAAPGEHGGGLQRGVVHLRVPRHTGTSFID